MTLQIAIRVMGDDMAVAKHWQTTQFRNSGLFSGIKSFTELERRIEALTDEKQKGDAFEVFAEAYLATQRVEMAKHVWPDKMIPPSLRKKLRLFVRDVGADGVIEMVSGKHRAYQVKFRSRRTPLTWSDTATFFGVTDHCDDRLLFTNSEDVSEVAEQRKDFSSIRGTDLDAMTADDFDAIRAWLAGKPVTRKKSSPRPYQQRALDAILPALNQQDRATSVMACGTGKTFVALWVAEAIAKKTVLVLVPSLALLRQTLREWVNHTTWESFDYLCVCSDPTVAQGVDELVVRPTELEFSVSTQPEQVREFLAHSFAGVKIIFSTYQSADVVARGMPRNLRFDIGIFDEAHKTAGREGAKFSFALKDENLPIRKRLFLTATPRHYDLRKRDKEGEPVEVYSMNRPEIYGPVVHTLSFAEAAKQKIICNYKVVISVVTSDMMKPHRACPGGSPASALLQSADHDRVAQKRGNHRGKPGGDFQQALRHGTVLINGDEVKTPQVANQIALAQAVSEHRLKKIFTFHRHVASARSFTGDGSEGIGTHLPGFAALHVNGVMSTAVRDGLMTEFKAARRAVMSNARCLTEGIDVPAVDMVAFLTPKRSKVDIVQAVGRAMRNAPGKTTGYILVPLYVEQAQGESLESAVARAEFDEVWSVLQAMQEQDDVLDDLIHELQTERRRTKGFSTDSRLRERVEVLGPTLTLDTLRRAITTRCLDCPWDAPRSAPAPWTELGEWLDRVCDVNIAVRNRLFGSFV
jgi:predicted helicase